MGGQDLEPPAKHARRLARQVPKYLPLVIALVGLVCCAKFALSTSADAEEVASEQVAPEAVVPPEPTAHAVETTTTTTRLAIHRLRSHAVLINPDHAVVEVPEGAVAAVAATNRPPPVASHEEATASPVTESSQTTAATVAEVMEELPEGWVSLRLDVGGEQKRLHLKLRPELSESSAAFMRHASTKGCHGQLYRSERDFLVQGRIDCSVLAPKVEKGSCPAGVSVDASRRCPPHDPNCGCHGPIMTKGMVAWAGGGVGPDLFIYTASMGACPVGACPATHWSHDHTVFAEVADEATWDILRDLYALPVREGGMTFFAKKIPFVVGR